jgi:hypothetical protein
LAVDAKSFLSSRGRLSTTYIDTIARVKCLVPPSSGKIEFELRSGGAALSPVIEHPQILLYSRIRKSPFFAASRRHGVAMYSVYNHM